MSEPLDLGALEARLTFGDSLDAAECGALIAALRAHRIALRPFAESTGLAIDTIVADWDRATEVLSSCIDGAPATQG